MVEAVFTPAHPHSLEPLLNQPLASTFHHPRAEGNLLLGKLLVLHMLIMTLKVGLYLAEGIQGGSREETGIQQSGQRLEDFTGPAMA